MKKVIFIIISHFLVINLSFAQYSFVETKADHEVEISTKSNSMYQTTLKDCPIEKGKGISTCSLESIYVILEENLIYPTAAKEAGIENQCEVYFSINENGAINKTLIRACHNSFENPINQVLKDLRFSNVNDSTNKIHRLDINFSLHGL